METREIAIIGCGAIGSILAKSIDQGEAGKAKLRYLFDMDKEQAKRLASELSNTPEIVEEINEILKDEKVNLVVEAASQEAAIEYSIDVLESGKDLMVLSIGAFSNDDFLQDAKETAQKVRQRIYLPSGAVLGLDGLKAVKMAKVNKVNLITRKPPKTLEATKFVKEQKLDLSGLEEPEIIFEGTAQEAVKEFPESVNVAATISLATVGFDQTKVKIIADPTLDRNVHEIRVEGEAGKFNVKASNVPSPDNPKTSYLAALSTVRALKNLTEALSIGT